MLALEDLKGMGEMDIIKHIAREYGGNEGVGYSCGSCATEEQQKEIVSELCNYRILVAYESVGSWGCDSSGFFLFRRISDGALFEMHGSHCSCYGFEGQYKLEETCVEALKMRCTLDGSETCFYLGAYDNNIDDNSKLVSEFIFSLGGSNER